jgi:hypothetical protein
MQKSSDGEYLGFDANYEFHHVYALKVCNLKEEVRSYQAHKQSKAEFQAVEEMLTLDNASTCDGNEGLCPRRCQTKK